VWRAVDGVITGVLLRPVSQSESSFQQWLARRPLASMIIRIFQIRNNFQFPKTPRTSRIQKFKNHHVPRRPHGAEQESAAKLARATGWHFATPGLFAPRRAPLSFPTPLYVPHPHSRNSSSTVACEPLKALSSSASSRRLWQTRRKENSGSRRSALAMVHVDISHVVYVFPIKANFQPNNIPCH